MKIENAPIKKPFINDTMVDGKVWIQWLTAFGSALQGDWTEGKRILVGGNSTKNYFSFQGLQVFCRIEFENALSGTIEVLDGKNKAIQFEDGMLNLYEGTTLIQGVEVSGTTINLPSLGIANRILTGTLVLKR
tara:strand:+ start:91 stop:489 length:399 start_codon:yes stop_codon:yes gene_type:complete